MSSSDIVVIGAGPAGLAVSACLSRAGVGHVVIDRAAEVGASWRGHYDRLHLHTEKTHSTLPYSSWPRQASRYPSRDEMIAYLERYAAQHRIAPVFDVEVRRIIREQRGYRLETSAGPLNPRAVVVATGYNRVPNRPAIQGLAAFNGSVVHSSAYRSPAVYRGKRTVVIGCGNSGAEIALDLAEHGVDVAMVVRGPIHVVPRDLLGRSSQQTAIALSWLPVGVRDRLVSPILRLAVGDLSPWGIVRPAIGLGRSIEQFGRIPLLDIGTIAQVKARRIRIVPAVQEVRPDRIVYVDGRSEPADAIVLATGYRSGLDRLVDGFASIGDGLGRPRGVEAAALPGLFFVGFTTPSTGALREIAREARTIIGKLKSGKVEK